MGVGAIVQIQDNNEWQGMYGVVDRVVHGVAFIFCVQFPCYLYRATERNNIRVIEGSGKYENQKNT